MDFVPVQIARLASEDRLATVHFRHVFVCVRSVWSDRIEVNVKLVYVFRMIRRCHCRTSSLRNIYANFDSSIRVLLATIHFILDDLKFCSSPFDRPMIKFMQIYLRFSSTIVLDSFARGSIKSNAFAKCIYSIWLRFWKLFVDIRPPVHEFPLCVCKMQSIRVKNEDV